MSGSSKTCSLSVGQTFCLSVWLRLSPQPGVPPRQVLVHGLAHRQACLSAPPSPEPLHQESSGLCVLGWPRPLDGPPGQWPDSHFESTRDFPPVNTHRQQEGPSGEAAGPAGGAVSWCAASLGEGQVREAAGRTAVPGPQISVSRREAARSSVSAQMSMGRSLRWSAVMAFARTVGDPEHS